MTSQRVSCFPVGLLAPRSADGEPPSYREHPSPCVTAPWHTHTRALTYAEDSLLPREGKTRATSTNLHLCPAEKVSAARLEQ